MTPGEMIDKVLKLSPVVIDGVSFVRSSNGAVESVIFYVNVGHGRVATWVLDQLLVTKYKGSLDELITQSLREIVFAAAQKDRSRGK